MQTPKTILAPMAGYTDVGFRHACALCGCDYTYTEMVSAKGLCYDSKKTQALLATSPLEKNPAVQIFGSDPVFIAQAVQHPALAKFKTIDINMGCPAPKIVKNGDGSALLTNMPLAEKIIKSAVLAAPAGVQITVKMRIGFDEKTDTQTGFCPITFARMVQDSGASQLTVHGRTREQFYMGQACHQVIAKIASALSIPVIANGDVTSSKMAKSVVEKTGTAGVMIGRAALGNPRVFGGGAEFSNKQLLTQQTNILLEHFDSRATASMMKAHLIQYVALKEERRKIGALLSAEEIFNYIENMSENA